MMSNFVELIQASLRRVLPELRGEESVDIEKIGENLTPNMRALRLTMTIADQLISMGVAASDVVHMALGITRTYCTRRVHIDVSHTIITLSQDRGIDREPLTVVRTIMAQQTNYQTIQQLQELANGIKDRKYTLTAAEKRLDTILKNPRHYPTWVSYLAGGGLSAGVSILFSGSIQIILLSFSVGTIISWLLARLGRLGIPTFFIQAIAAGFVTLTAAALTWLVRADYIDIISHINPTLIVIGGIVLLVAGMMIVGAFQDAIDEYYVTASARILKVVMMTGGIVMGVVIGLSVSKSFGVEFVASPDRLSLSSIGYQYLGAGIIAASFALGNHARLRGLLLAGAIGVLGYWCMLIATEFPVGQIASYGIAAGIVGFGATAISRAWRIPSMATISSGIVPLVPGLSLYNGLMLIVQSSPGTNDFTDGITVLLRALLIAVVIAAGASFGNILGRPMRRKLVQIHNRLPLRALSSGNPPNRPKIDK